MMALITVTSVCLRNEEPSNYEVLPNIPNEMDVECNIASVGRQAFNFFFLLFFFFFMCVEAGRPVGDQRDQRRSDRSAFDQRAPCAIAFVEHLP
jgi:hypothetical protein